MADPTGLYAASLDASVDALSDVLDLIHLQGGELAVVRAAGTTDIRHRAGQRLLHLVEQGPVEIEMAAGEQHRLETGNLALMATGAAHRLSSPAGGAWMSGRFLVEEKVAMPLLAVLPSAIVIRSSDAAFDWLPLGASLLAAELADPSAGSRVMVSRLLDLLLILTLRAWSATDGAPDPGLLTAALDRQLGPALAAVHRHPEHPWTVEELAGLASLSRGVRRAIHPSGW